MEEDNDDDDLSDRDVQSNVQNSTKSGGGVDTQSKTSTTAYTDKDSKIKKKKTQVKKRSIARNKKQPYNEGAEETKNWLAES
jgi:hypothetical protein